MSQTNQLHGPLATPLSAPIRVGSTSFSKSRSTLFIEQTALSLSQVGAAITFSLVLVQLAWLTAAHLNWTPAPSLELILPQQTEASTRCDTQCQRQQTEFLAVAHGKRLLHEAPERGAEVLQRVYVQTDNVQLQQEIVAWMVEQTPADLPNDYRGEFLSAILPGAIQTGRDHGIPPSITLAQAILESGWGRSGLARNHNNLFGVKSGAKTGPSIRLKTVEYASNSTASRKTIQASFRTFPSWDESIVHHALLLNNDKRYKGAASHRADWQQYLQQIAPIYASDPRYVSLISSIVLRYELDRWDWVVPQSISTT